MHMIDVLKRLAELDSMNPNVIKENEQVDECGMMPEMGMMAAPERPSHPASINMSAGSGEELSDMLTTIMTLAGQKTSAPVSAAPALDNTPPAAGTLEPASGGDARDSMRSVIDKLNPMDNDDEDGEDQDRKEVDEYDNTPNDPNKDVDEFDPDQHAHQENQPGQGDRMDGTSPKAYADMNEAVADLFAQYKKFVSEN